MGKKSRKKKGGGGSGKKHTNKTTPSTNRSTNPGPDVTTAPRESVGNFFDDDVLRPYQESYGRVLTLFGVQSPQYRGKEALCVGYDNSSERLIVWPLETANQILVDPVKCNVLERYTIEDCRRENREKQSEERRVEAKYDECSICLEVPRAPVELPCLHRFCASCIARLRSPREMDFELRCPNCRALMPAMFEKLLVTADDITVRMIKGLVCFDAECTSSNRHAPGGYIITDEAVNLLKKARGHAAEQNDITPFLHVCDNLLRGFAKSATVGHKSASPVKAHRDLMRGVACELMPEVMKLRRQFEGCLQVRSTCGGIDSKLEETFMKVYGKPLLSPEEQRAKCANSRSLFKGTFEYDKNIISEASKSNDGKFMTELSMLIIENLEGSWCYIRSFGLHYDRMLGGFANAAGQMINYDTEFCKTLTEDWAVDTWAMRRLDAMEELFDKEEAYRKFEAQEANSLIQLLYNVIFTAVGKRQVQLDMFIRSFGQEYMLREIEGGVDPKCRELLSNGIASQLRKVGYTDEFDRPLFLLRPCSTSRYIGVHTGCRMKESRPNEFIRCRCKRMAYCSPHCKMMHEDDHATACLEALRARRRLGER